MALLDDVKVALRVATDAMDGEVSMWVDAAKADMARVGVPPSMLSDEGMDPYVKCGVVEFVKARFGYDNSEASRFESSYRQIVRDILNSPATYPVDGGGDGR